MPNYVVTIASLERVVARRNSAEKIEWTNELQGSFDAAKALAANPVGISEPRPDEVSQTFSDYYAETRAVGGRAVGGRMVILRKNEHGE